MNAVDTNVLLYACDHRDPRKRGIALSLIDSAQSCVLLWQVACEFIAASRKLSGVGFGTNDAWELLDELRMAWPLIRPGENTLLTARELHLRGISFWDALIIGACLEAGVTTLYTEDIPGTTIRGLAIVNPFAA